MPLVRTKFRVAPFEMSDEEAESLRLQGLVVGIVGEPETDGPPGDGASPDASDTPDGDPAPDGSATPKTEDKPAKEPTK